MSFSTNQFFFFETTDLLRTGASEKLDARKKDHYNEEGEQHQSNQLTELPKLHLLWNQENAVAWMSLANNDGMKGALLKTTSFIFFHMSHLNA